MPPFITPLAVDTWDASYRWREGGRLRDLTIDATWERVADALAGTSDGDYRRDLIDAFSSWQLLLDDRILAEAGTGGWNGNDDMFVAVLNIAAFVRAPCTPRASIDLPAIERIAALAVRALDDAATWHPTPPPLRFGIGVMGVADALSLMNIQYENPLSRNIAMRVSRALAHGCLAASVDLAQVRGPHTPCDGAWRQRAAERGMPEGLIEKSVRFGLRHTALTAIAPRKKLARFANCVADALDPLGGDRDSTSAHVAANGYATNVRRHLLGAVAEPGPDRFANVVSQLELRGAMQPWIDARIDYPVRVLVPPDEAAVRAWSALAADLELGPFTWSMHAASPA
ncbi:MAG: hypothetical protein ABJB01_08975 [Rudaea sp.]